MRLKPQSWLSRLLVAGEGILRRTGILKYIRTKRRALFGHGPRAFQLSDLLTIEPLKSPDPDKVSIVVPVYNNIEDITDLIANLKTTVRDDAAKIILVNDCSPDERILPLLNAAAQGHANWLVINNATNLGFAAAVNKGITASEGHVIVLNSDIECPPGWIERLLTPITLNPEGVASVTPFSNHSSLTGFPRFSTEAPLGFIGKIEDVNRVFLRNPPVSIDTPSGVGFCLALNRKTIDRIGVFDEIYKRGYYEDTDWCQRAENAGFRNVVCGNLFVHHKIGSKSFSIPTRRALSHANFEIFRQRHPEFKAARRRFQKADPLLEVRSLAQATLWRGRAASAHLFIDDLTAGGSNDFSERYRNALVMQNAFIVKMVLREEETDILIYYSKGRIRLRQPFNPELMRLAKRFDVNEVVLNRVEGGNDIHGLVSKVSELSSERRVSVNTHDPSTIRSLIFL